jgi:hypothetical protein
VQTARLGEGLVVDAGEAHAEGDGEGRLLGAEGHLVEDHGAEVALVLGRAAEVEELALRTPSTGGTVGRSVRLGECGDAAYGAAAYGAAAYGAAAYGAAAYGAAACGAAAKQEAGLGVGEGGGRRAEATPRAPKATCATAGGGYACRGWGRFEWRAPGHGPAGRSTWWPRPRAAPRWRRWRGGTGRRATRGC